MPELSRRGVLVGLAVAGGAWISKDPVVSGGAVSESDPRDQALRPVMGGTWISAAGIDAIGTLGIGLEYDGAPAVVTNRHVVDHGSDEDAADVQGRTVYQPDQDAGAIGEVVDASQIGGQGSSDWAVVAISDSSDWSTHTLGFGGVGAPATPSAGERVVIDGAWTGLIGGEITRVGVDANFRGELYSDLIEYTVDENRDTDGNSGSVVATIDDSGVVHPTGLHTFAIDEYRFAIPWSDLPSSVALSDGGASPVPPAVGPNVEAAVFDERSGGWWIWVRNLGDLEANPTVALKDPDSGDVLASQTVSIEPFEDVALALDPGVDRARLVAGQTDVVVDLS